MIHLDTGKIGQVDQKTMEDKIEESNKILVSKPFVYGLFYVMMHLDLVMPLTKRRLQRPKPNASFTFV